MHTRKGHLQCGKFISFQDSEFTSTAISNKVNKYSDLPACINVLSSNVWGEEVQDLVNNTFIAYCHEVG